MPKPPEAVEVKARKKFINFIIPRSSATSKYLVSESSTPSPQGKQQERSPQSEAQQLDLLALLEKSLEPIEPALRIEAIPANVAIGSSERFWLIHQASGLQVPGQFSRQEAEHILKATECWDWEIQHRPRTPNCSYQLFCLLRAVCTPQIQEVAA